MNTTEASYLHIPDRLPNFTNRKEELKEVERQLLLKRVPALLIWGEAGVGKTSLARQLINSLAEKKIYHSIIWTTAKLNELEVVDRFTTGPNIIDIPRRGVIKKVPYKKVRKKTGVFVESLQGLFQTILLYSGYEDFHSAEILEEIWDDEDLLKKEVLVWMQEKRILLVVDDLDSWMNWSDLFNFLEFIYFPSAVIITSRRFLGRTIKGLGDLNIALLPIREREKLLNNLIEVHKIKIDDREKWEIIQYSEGNPLILKLIVGLISLRSKGLTNVSRKVSKKVLKEVLNSMIDNRSIVDFLFEDLYDHLEGISPMVLQAVAILKTKTDELKFDTVKQVLNTEEPDLDNAMDELSASSLLSYDNENPDIISIHPLVQDFVLAKDKRIKNKVQKLVDAYFSSNG
jgi:DNA polymerase III delta prime subunit